MEASLAEKVEASLKARFAGASVELDPPVPGERIGGFLIWDGFDGVEQIERQRQVWKELRDKLDASEQQDVSAILTLTPDEVSVVPED